MRKHRKSRRGALMLIVLGILVLFVLIGLTFVLVTGNFRDGAVSHSLKQDSPSFACEEAVRQLIRGTAYDSSIRGHSLLRDLYGSDSGLQTLTSVANNGNGTAFELHFTNPATNGLSTVPYFYTGRVLTMLTGKARFRSARVLDYRQVGTTSEWVLMVTPFNLKYEETVMDNSPDTNAEVTNPAGIGTTSTLIANYLSPKAGDVFIINGGAYNGTQDMDVTDANFTIDFSTGAFGGGFDEPWDAPDVNNMFLASLPAVPTPGTIVPSFYRPYLLTAATATDSAALSRRSLRPNHIENPDFDGGNPFFTKDGSGTNLTAPFVQDPTTAGFRWDVDNDRDGVHDSIWIDPGMPERTTPDGRRYRELVAILCVDLDGRLNVNAHGSTSTATTTTPKGLGFGPADVDLTNVLSSSNLATRYTGSGNSVPGRTGDDFMSKLMNPGLPTGAGTLAAPYHDLYRHVPSFWGDGTATVDALGAPTFGNPTVGINDDPYELDLVSSLSSQDSPFLASDMEGLLRTRDADTSSLSYRLASLVGASYEAKGKYITTHSFDVPSLPFDWINKVKTDAGLTNANSRDELRKLLPLEILRGEKMNINRLFGNGRDDNNNNIVDEPGESPGSIHYRVHNGVDSAIPTAANMRGTISLTGQQMRQYFARGLYCMACFLNDSTKSFPFVEGANVELTRRRLAQWAVNVIDFRDPDGIMTRFEYDSNPFNGWNATLANSTEYGVVWGSESPSLVISETFATHVKGLRDTNKENPTDTAGEDVTQPQKRKHTDVTKIGDKDLDQFIVPQGSLFIELFCLPNVRGKEQVELARQVGSSNVATGYVNVSRRANLPTSSVSYPVWRLVVTNRHSVSTNTPASLVRTRPDSFEIPSFQINSGTMTAQMQSTSDAGARLAGISSISASALKVERIVWLTPPPSNAPVDNVSTFYMPTGTSDVVLNSGEYLMVGPRIKTFMGLSNSDATGATASTQKIDFSLAAPHINSAGTATGDSSKFRTVKYALAQAEFPANWSTIATTFGAGDRSITGIGLSVSEPLPASGSYYAPPTDASKFPYYDDPASPAGSLIPDKPEDDASTPLGGEAGMLEEKTTQNYKTVLLQRLADPTKAYNPTPSAGTTSTWNPYITVDWHTIDLTVLNGADARPGGWDSAQQVGPAASQVDVGFFDLGHPYDAGDDPDVAFSSNERLHWNGVNIGIKGSSESVTAASHPAVGRYWGHRSLDTSGTDKTTSGGGTDYFKHNLVNTIGYLNSLYGGFNTTATGVNLGAPAQPIPWLTWHDRMYANHMELLLVPTSGPSRLLTDLSTPVSGIDPYGIGAYNSRGEFPHLLNFFDGEMRFARLLDSVEVPSRFAGTRRYFRPTDSNSWALHAPPYNYASKFRSPGTININTVQNPMVWNAIYPNSVATLWSGRVATFSNITTSRNTGASIKPFKSAFSPAHKPTSSSVLSLGLLRKGSSDTSPLISESGATAASTRSRDRHAYFRYQPLVKAGNILTTKSNVYAVWVTSGRFELDDSGRLGKELGTLDGTVVRQRSFYMIDRSIPVGFNPGENLNSDNAIILRRTIE